jgi:eukaryotic-like serine/threonine-protein kinase
VIWTVGLTLAGRYRLDAALGASSTPRVWSATHLPTGRRVAIRRLAPVPELPKRAEAQLLAEVRAAASVEHPNVTTLYEVVEGVDEGPLIVSELLRGETLAQKLSRNPMLSVSDAASLILPVVSAVGTAHARGVVHGGLTTGAVFLSAANETAPAVKVLDFGVARWAAGVLGAAPPSVRAGATAQRANSDYRPPELALPDRVVDHRADIWGLGILLYECLSGLRPQEFAARDAEGVVVIEPIEQRDPGVPRALADIISHLLVSDPDHRAQNLIELYNALVPLAERPSPSFGWPGSERRISGLTQRASVLDLPTAALPPPKTPEPPPPWRALAIGAVAVAAAELVALTWLLGRSPDKEARAAQASATMAQAETLPLQAAPPVPRVAALLDDFEDGDGEPSTPAFANWQAFTVNPAGRALGLKLGVGYQSRGSVEMSWLLEHVLDGKLGPPGAGLRSTVRAGAVDLSRYGYISFAHRFAPMNTPGLECKGVTEFVVFVTCRSLGQDRAPQFELPVSVSEVWTSTSIDLRDLREVGGPLPRATNLKACLAATDSLGFRADAPLAKESDGCDSGRLWLDDIGLR